MAEAAGNSYSLHLQQARLSSTLRLDLGPGGVPYVYPAWGLRVQSLGRRRWCGAVKSGARR
jgi:hypothetical protein